MELKDYGKKAERIVEDLLQIDLFEITYKKRHMERTVAEAYISKKEIIIGKSELKYNSEKGIINALVHEIFHLLAPSGHGHHGDWLKYAKLFNSSKYVKTYGKIEARRSKLLKDKFRYITECQSCDYFRGRYRYSKLLKNFEKLRCPKCKSPLDLYGPKENGKRKKYKRIKTPKYIFECLGCGRTEERYREDDFVKEFKRYSCGKCHGKFKQLK